MAKFLRKQITDGPLKGQYEWVPLYTGSFTPEQVTLVPNTVTLPHKKRFECLLCTKTYASVAIFANHFAHSHKEQDTEKDAWRKYVKDTKEV
jgi:hypothetical protein